MSDETKAVKCKEAPQTELQPDPMQPAIDAMEADLLEWCKGADQPSPAKASTTRTPSEAP